MGQDMTMKQGSEDFLPESTPVIDLRKNGLPPSIDSSANDPTQNWDNDKTEVYMDSDEDDASAFLIDTEGDSHPITAFPFVMGRGTECDLVLSGKGLSRKHVEIVFQSGRFVVNDLESLNGLKVNGYKVSRVILEEGDVLKLGEAHLTFSTGNDAQVAPTETSGEVTDSDPFLEGGKNKAKLIGGVVGIVFVGAVASFAYQSMSSSQPVNRIVNAQPTKPPVVASKPASIASPVVSATQTINIAPPKTLSSPPPSISITPVKEPTKRIVKPVAKAPAKPKSNKFIGQAKKLLANANSRYLDGDADELFKAMKVLKNNSKLSNKLRSQLKSKHESLAAVYVDYVKGQKAYAQGNSDGAFNYWTRFLEKEGRLFKKSRSLYADQVVIRVVDEYVTRGNAASQAGESHKAYKMWQKAVKLGDSVAAKIALDSVNAKSKQMYRKALRLEYVNASKAKALWQEVVSLVPPGTEYYTKASSKLAWYERWGG